MVGFLVLIPLTIQILWKDGPKEAVERETENLKSQFVELSLIFQLDISNLNNLSFPFVIRTKSNKSC